MVQVIESLLPQGNPRLSLGFCLHPGSAPPVAGIYGMNQQKETVSHPLSVSPPLLMPFKQIKIKRILKTFVLGNVDSNVIRRDQKARRELWEKKVGSKT